MVIRISTPAGAAALAAAIIWSGAGAASSAPASCNPNTGCLPRPVSVQEVGGPFGYRYVVRPKTLDIVQTKSEHIYATGLHWSRWTGGYGVHGLFGGSAEGTGTLHATGSGSRRVTIYLWDVLNGGVNAFTYYEKLSIHGDGHVPAYWHWSNTAGRWLH